MSRSTSYILGISAFYHDSAACLLRDGEILGAAQEERFTRRKGDASFPQNAIEFCLRRAGISVGFVERSDVLALMRGAVALVFPSRFEGFGLPLLEAIQCGTPVVAAATAVIPEVVGTGGLLVPPDDAKAWVEALHKVVTDAHVGARLIAAGYANVGRFSWDRCALQTVDVLRQAAHHG